MAATSSHGLGYPDSVHVDDALAATRELGPKAPLPTASEMTVARFWRTAPPDIRPQVHLSQNAEVLVVGAGVVGAAIAAELASLGRDVMLLEQGVPRRRRLRRQPRLHRHPHD